MCADYAVPARRESLRGLPAAWIGVGDIDLFHDEDSRYAARLRDAGVTAELDVVPGAPHGFENWAIDSVPAQALLARGRAWLAAQLHAHRHGPARDRFGAPPHIPPGCLVLISMNTSFRRAVLVVTAALGLYVGVWAAGFPESFYSSFPGFGLHWIDISGAFNEHLIGDVGYLYLALTAITIWAIFDRAALPGRLAGLGWTVFGFFHFLFHITHPEGGAIDITGNVVTLLLSLVLGVILLLPSRVRATTKEASA